MYRAPSPISPKLQTSVHKELKFKEQTKGGKVLPSSFYAVIAYNETETFGGYFLKCELQQRALVMS